MKNLRFWIPAMIGALFVPVTFYLMPIGSTSHAGAGLVTMFVFYPLPFLGGMFLSGAFRDDAFLSQVIRFLILAAMLLQFPFYGFVISYARLKKSIWLKIAAVIVWLHVIAIGAFLAIFSMQMLL